MRPRSSLFLPWFNSESCPEVLDVLVMDGCYRWCGWGETWAMAGDVGRDVSLTKVWPCDKRRAWTVGVGRKCLRSAFLAVVGAVFSCLAPFFQI